MANARMPDEFFEAVAHRLPPEQPVGPKGGRPRIAHRVYPSYGPHLEGHGTIPSDRSVSSEGASSWRNAVANDVTPQGRSSGGGRSEIRSGAACPSTSSVPGRG